MFFFSKKFKVSIFFKYSLYFGALIFTGYGAIFL